MQCLQTFKKEATFLKTFCREVLQITQQLDIKEHGDFSKTRFKVGGYNLQVYLARNPFLNVDYLSTTEAISSVGKLDSVGKLEVFHFNIHNYGRA